MKVIKIEGVCDKFTSFFLHKHNIKFNFLKLKKIKGRETYQMIDCGIKKQIGEFFKRQASMTKKLTCRS